jgi:hypothetical protein
MDTNLAKILPETRLEEGTSGRSQRLPRGTKYGMDQRRRLASGNTPRLSRHRNLFFLAGRTQGPTRRTSCTLSLNSWLRHPHDHICHTIGFLLIGIAGLADGQLGLEKEREAGSN